MCLNFVAYEDIAQKFLILNCVRICYSFIYVYKWLHIKKTLPSRLGTMYRIELIVLIFSLLECLFYLCSAKVQHVHFRISLCTGNWQYNIERAHSLQGKKKLF